jgi:hypothetical protein
LIFRYSDDANEWLINSNTTYEILKRESGSLTVMATSAQTPTNGDVINVLLSGTSITLLVNGTIVSNVVSSFNQNSTNVGLSSSGNGTVRFDNFKVEALP